MGRWGQEIDWSRRRVGLVFAVAVALNLALATLDALVHDLQVFGYDVSGWVGGGLTGVAIVGLMRRWQTDERP